MAQWDVRPPHIFISVITNQTTNSLTSYLSIWLTKIGKYLREKVVFLLYFYLAGDLV